MTQLPLEVYRIDMKNIRNLHNIDDRYFNLMISVENAQIQRIDTKIRKHDNMDTRRKKELLVKELEWCNEHISDLANTANVLYQKYITRENFAARKQCLDFKRIIYPHLHTSLKIQSSALLQSIRKR